MKRNLTKRAEKATKDLSLKTIKFYSSDVIKAKLNELLRAEGKSNRPSVLKSLFDILDACGIPYEKNKPTAYYVNLVNNAHLSDNESLVIALFEEYKNYPSPEDCLKRIVDNMEKDKDDWGKDTLRLRILKQFIKYGNCLSDFKYGGKQQIVQYAKFKKYFGDIPEELIDSEKKKKVNRTQISVEEIVQYVDDNIFKLLDGAKPEQKKSNGRLGLLRLVDDLVKGRFDLQGSIKEGLYLFAIVYNMTYGFDDKHSIVNSDIKQNIFEDYYNNNIIRFLDGYIDGDKMNMEKEPSGQVINYKNFAEMIFLYYIAKDNMDSQQKIKECYSMIERVKKDITEVELLQEVKEFSDEMNSATKVYKSKIDSKIPEESILKMDAIDFEMYLCKHYNHSTKQLSKNGKPIDVKEILIENNQNTAFKCYQMMQTRLNKVYQSLESEGLMNYKDRSYGIYFTDVKTLIETYNTEYIYRNYPDINKDDYERFLKLLDIANDLLIKKSGVANGVLNIQDSSQISRTSLLVMFYYSFNAENYNNAFDMDFLTFFEYFKSKADIILEEALYPKLSIKNLLDILIVYSSYAYIKL